MESYSRNLVGSILIPYSFYTLFHFVSYRLNRSTLTKLVFYRENIAIPRPEAIRLDKINTSIGKRRLILQKKVSLIVFWRFSKQVGLLFFRRPTFGILNYVPLI